NVSFKASTNVALKVNGESDKLVVKSDGKALRFSVAVKDLSTGMSLRDKHMQDTFEVEKYPEVTLEVPLEGLQVPADGASGSGEAKGALGLHGVTKDLPFKYTAACKAGTCDVEATADINAADHGMNMPSHLGIKVKPGVAIQVKFQVKR
ncbi:MAG: YceI family protein, partial [Deltaproteobacteria bacterium]|nr:YceI family protein [Deltaproteobacteria bacterium]